MSETNQFLEAFISASLGAKLLSALTAMGVIDTILRRIPYVRSIFVYLAKAFGVGIIVCEYGQKISFWITDKISLVIPDKRPPLKEGEVISMPIATVKVTAEHVVSSEEAAASKEVKP